MERVKIEIEKDVKYISTSNAFKKGLPTNCIFDKGKVGCGGTTLAINSGSDYVIAVPFVALIENKVSQSSNIIPFYSGISLIGVKRAITDTITAGKPVIIMTTYDGLGKITDAINEVIVNGVSKFKLLVDEYHILFTQYCFRNTAINTVLNNYKLYKEYCFMTATVLEDDFILDELKDIPVIEAVWSDVSIIKINAYKSISDSSVVGLVADLIMQYINGTSKLNAYIFVNSVSFIKEVIELVNKENQTDTGDILTIANTNLIYGKSNVTVFSIERGLLPTVKLHEAGYIKPKKINLITSTMFEGGDIYDENGITYVVSDASKLHSLIDISTSFQQIAGRIRNSSYSRVITHIYSTTRYTGIQTYEEFKEQSRLDNATSLKFMLTYETLDADFKKMIKEVNALYLTKDSVTGLFKFNPNLLVLDLYNFKITKHNYQVRFNDTTGKFKDEVDVNLFTEYLNNGFDIADKRDVYCKYIGTKDDIIEKFEDCVKELESTTKLYSQLKDSNVITDSLLGLGISKLIICSDELELRSRLIYAKYPFLKEAIEVLGFDGIAKLKYVITNIKRKLIMNNTKGLSIDNRAFALINSYANRQLQGSIIPIKEAKDIMTKVYADLDIKVTAKGSDILKYYSGSESSRLINGKSTGVYKIGNPKVCFND